MKSKIFLYIGIFLILSLLFEQLNKIFETERLQNISYTNGEIYKFTLVGVNEDRYILTGDKMTELQEKVIIDGFNLNYQKNKENILIKSKQGIYHKKNKILDLFYDVQIISKDLKLKTEKLKFLTKERRAYNTEKVKLFSKNMQTDGENVFIDLVNERLKLENVKSVFWGS